MVIKQNNFCNIDHNSKINSGVCNEKIVHPTYVVSILHSLSLNLKARTSSVCARRSGAIRT